MAAAAAAPAARIVRLVEPIIGVLLEIDDPSAALAVCVDAYLLAVGQYHPLQLDDLLAVEILISDARDHIARLHRRLVPAVPFHPGDGGAADLPLLRPAVIGLNLKSDHRVRIGPHELDDLALH